MKKQKITIQNSEQQSLQDIATIKEMQEGLTKIDQFPIYTPNLQWFDQMVLQEQQKARKKLVRDVAVFLMIAIFTLTGLVLSLYNMPIIFFILQIATTIFLVIYTSVRLKKKAYL